jgi:ElaB/YqjD/DUF883 family membrane-anchored ribosome-binding protein
MSQLSNGKEAWAEAIERAKELFTRGWSELTSATEQAKERGQDALEEAQEKAREVWQSAKESGVEKWGDLRERGEEAWEETRERASDAVEDVEKIFKRHPGRALGLTLLVGTIIGLLLSSSSQDEPAPRPRQRTRKSRES